MLTMSSTRHAATLATQAAAQTNNGGVNADIIPATITSAFSGWHYSAATIGNSTVGAIAVNSMAATIRDQLALHSCFPDPTAALSSQVTGEPPAATAAPTSGTADYIATLQTDTKAQTRPLLQSPTVLVIGSAYNATPTLCYVDAWLSATPLFTVVKSKALIHTQLMYKDWQQENNMVCVNDNIGSAGTDVSHHMAFHLKHSDQGMNADVLTSMQHVAFFDVAVASLYLATLVHHMMVTDGGTQFRDKQGRTAAAHQVALSCQNILFLIDASTFTF